MGVLTVTLEKVMNIRDKDGLGRSDPYVMFELNKKRIGFDRTFERHESSRKGNTCNPEFNETFTFPNVPDLNEMELVVKVMDDDIGKDDCLGKVEIDLEFANLSGSPKEFVSVIDPKRFKIFSEEATIHLQIAFEA